MFGTDYMLICSVLFASNNYFNLVHICTAFHYHWLTCSQKKQEQLHWLSYNMNFPSGHKLSIYFSKSVIPFFRQKHKPVSDQLYQIIHYLGKNIPPISYLVIFYLRLSFKNI